MGRRTYVEAVRLADELLRTGWPVIVDGSFSHAVERAEARAVADRHGLPFAVLWCDAPDEALVKRLRSRSEDRHEVSDGREELVAEHRARYESPAHEPGVVRLDTGGEMAKTVEQPWPRLAISSCFYWYDKYDHLSRHLLDVGVRWAP